MRQEPADSVSARPSSNPAAAVAAILLVFIAVVLVPVWLRAARFCFNNYDLGIYGQALAQLGPANWNPWLSGRQVFLFADHFDPVLVFAVPFARALGLPWGGLLAEALFVGASVIPIVLLVRRGDLSSSGGLLLSALLLFNAATVSALGFPIHPTTWAVLPWTWLVLAMRRNALGSLLAALVLLFACKEEFPFVGLVLGALLLAQRRWRDGGAVLAVSLLWLGFVYGIRPSLVGPTEGYASGLFEGLTVAPGAYLAERIGSRHMWTTLGLLVAPFVPLGVFCWREKLRPQWILLALLVPPLAIRFLGDAWRHHYGAVLVAGLVGFFVGWLRDRAVPKWVTASVMLALLLTGIPRWRDAFTVALGDRFPKNCPGAPERVAAIRESVEELRRKPGPLLVGGNLLPDLADRKDVFMIGGPVPNERFAAVLVEKPPHGDPWPLDAARVEALIEHWHSLPGVRVVRDDAEVFFAEGDLRESR